MKKIIINYKLQDNESQNQDMKNAARKQEMRKQEIPKNDMRNQVALENDKNKYYQKYIKYKNKYLQLKYL